jgi:hypothetical protein
MLIDKDFLAMFEVGLIEKGAGTDLLKGRIIVVDAAVKAMCILMACQEILFNTFGTGGCLAEFTS